MTMANYYRTYYFSNFEEENSNPTIAFILVTDAKNTEILFPETASEEIIETLSQAIGARLEALESVDKVTGTDSTAEEILDAVTYNMQVFFYKDEEGLEEFSSFNDAMDSAKDDLIDDYSSEGFSPKSYKPIYPKDQESMTAAGEQTCPPATQDIGLNLKNRKNAIDTAMYGPLNPEEPNEEYWQGLASEWKVDVETAKKQRCGNCAVFVITTDMKNCIAQGIEQGGSSQSDAWDAIGTAELGYCEAFDFKCAASRTCRAWVTGGPLDDNKAKE